MEVEHACDEAAGTSDCRAREASLLRPPRFPCAPIQGFDPYHELRATLIQPLEAVVPMPGVRFQSSASQSVGCRQPVRPGEPTA